MLNKIRSKIWALLAVCGQVVLGGFVGCSSPFLREDVNDAVFPRRAASQQKSIGILPSLACVSRTEVKEKIFLNGFSLSTLGELTGDATDYTSIMPLHPYFVKSGENQLQVFSAETLSGTPSEITLAIVEWDYVYGKTLQETSRMQCLVLSKGQQIKSNGSVFSWNEALPQWSWQRGVPLHEGQETKQQLYQEVIQMHATLGELAKANEKVRALKKEWKQSTKDFIQASELRGKSYVLIDQILEAATKKALPKKPAGSLVLQPLPELDALQLEIFAEGTLARLQNTYDQPLFSYTSNLPDGPRGRRGETKLAFDLWYRKNHAGEWELDAIYPREAPNTWSGFQMNFNDLENLFRLTNF